MKDVKIYGTTDVGIVRTQNEDNYLILEYKEMSIVCVADGMGGHVGGKEASLTAVNTIKSLFKQNRGKLNNSELIEDCLMLSNSRIRERARSMYADSKTGTTAILVAVGNQLPGEQGARKKNEHLVTSIEPLKKQSLTATYGHIGDSRLYSMTGDKITQVSKDHTMLQRMLDADALKPEEAENYPYKNVIYKSLGGSENADLDPVKNFEFAGGEALLLCSDGLSGYLSSSEIHNIIKGTKNIREAADYMVELAKFRGGDDNITVIIVEHGKFKRDKNIKLEGIPRTSGEKSRAGKTVAVLTLLAVLIILFSLLIFLLKDKENSQEDGKDGGQVLLTMVSSPD